MSGRPWPQFDGSLLPAIEAWRTVPTRKPLVRYTCDYAASGGRGSCTLLEVWNTPDGPLVYFPAYRVSKQEHDRRQGRWPEDLRGGMEGRHYAARVSEVLRWPVVIKDYGETDALNCAHRVADLDINQLWQDVLERRPYRVLHRSDGEH